MLYKKGEINDNLIKIVLLSVVSNNNDAKNRYFLEYFKKKSLGSGYPVWVATGSIVDNGTCTSN